jgi:hypothetical protein
MAALMRTFYSRVVDAYCAQLRARPWTTQAASSAVLW